MRARPCVARISLCVTQICIKLGDLLVRFNLLGLGQKHWPKASLTDALAAEAAKLRKKGLKQVFTYSDLKKWLPDWASGREEEPDHTSVSKEIREIAEDLRTSRCARALAITRICCSQAIAKPKDKGRSYIMGLAAWHVAWTRHCKHPKRMRLSAPQSRILSQAQSGALRVGTAHAGTV